MEVEEDQVACTKQTEQSQKTHTHTYFEEDEAVFTKQIE